MRAAWFINMRVATEVTRRGPSGTSIMVMAHLLRAVHGIAKHAGFAFASAFPESSVGERAHPGSLLRIFLDSREDGDALLDALEANTFLAGYVHLDRVRPVPQGLKGSVSYQRFKIPAEGSRNEKPRVRRLAEGDDLPYLHMESASNGGQFGMRFRVVFRPSGPSEACEPNGYGLSVRDREFFLPNLPVERAPWQCKNPAVQAEF